MNKAILFCCACVALFFASCSTDVEVNAPYKATPVVYGVLELNAADQYIKINKTFQGMGNNLDYALIRDSSEYADDAFTAVIQEIDESGDVAETFELTPIILENKEQEEGDIFYAPEQKVYTFNAGSPNETGEYLNKDASYRLRIDFANGERVEAITDLPKTRINDITGPNFYLQGNAPSEINFINSVSGVEPTYRNYNFKFVVRDNGAVYSPVLRFYYTEEKYASSDFSGSPISSEDTFMEIVLPLVDATDINSGQQYTEIYDGERFFQILQDRLTADPTIRRVPGFNQSGFYRYFDFFVTAGNFDLKTYLDINEPITGVATERPEFTNLSNALGLFAGRSTIAVTGVQSEGANFITALASSPYTSDLNFCVNADEWPGSSGQSFLCD